MPTLTLLKGLPASGKSTWAKEQVDKNPHGVVRINNDDLRAMLNNSVYGKNNETHISMIREQLVVHYLKNGYNVIIDNTNLNPRHPEQWKAICIQQGYQYQEKEFDTPLEECIARDAKRTNPVGEKVIRDMAKQWNYYPQEKPEFKKITQPEGGRPAIIVDIDGTVAKMCDRNPYDFTKVSGDTPYTDIINLVEMIMVAGYDVLFVSGREETCREETEVWLMEHFNIPTNKLYMRKAGDKRMDSYVKYEILQELIKGYHIDYVFDDRTQVVRMWRQAGLRCLQVQDGDF